MWTQESAVGLCRCLCSAVSKPVCVAAIAASLCLSAQGAARVPADRKLASPGAERNTLRLMRKVPAEKAEEATAAESTAEDGPWTLSLGVSRERADAGNTVTTPFALGWSSTNWYFEVSGDGYQNVSLDGVRYRGLADIALVLNYTHPFGQGGRYGVTPELEVDLPTHGDVGSRRASQWLRLSLTHQSEKWGWAARVGVGRAGDAVPDTSRYSRTAWFRLHRDFDRDTKTGLKLSRSLRAGAPPSSGLTWDLQFPLSLSVDRVTKLRKVWTGTLLLGRQRSGDSSARIVEFDLVYAF